MTAHQIGKASAPAAAPIAYSIEYEQYPGKLKVYEEVAESVQVTDGGVLLLFIDGRVVGAISPAGWTRVRPR